MFGTGAILAIHQRSEDPSLKWDKRYKYLGVHVGRERAASFPALEQTIIAEAQKILSSALTDWQKIEALNTFVLTKAQYRLRADLVARKWALNLDKTIRKSIKKALRLPRRTTTHLFYTSRKHGGLGVFSIEDSLDVFRATHFYKCLSCPDPTVSGCAWDQLWHTVSKRSGIPEPSDSDIESFLNSSPGRGEGGKGDVQSLWSVVRRSLRRLVVAVTVSDHAVSMECPAGSISDGQRDKVANLLRQQTHQLQLSQLMSCQDQGRPFALVSKSADSNSWIANGKYLSFSDYRFAVKARCNLLPVRSVQRRIGVAQYGQCTRCTTNQPETMAHVLNYGLMRERHNRILHRLARAVPDSLGTKFLDQSIPGAPAPRSTGPSHPQ